MPQYPVNTGETTFVKDSLDSKVKLLDTVIQLLRAADSAEASARADAISTLQAALSTLETDVAAAQSLAESAYNLADAANDAADSSYIMRRNKDNTPSTDNVYDFGSSSLQWANIFSRAMTIGRNGYEWDINTNDGYVTLPSGAKIQWGRKTTSSSQGTISFASSFFSSVNTVIANVFDGDTDAIVGITIKSISKSSFSYWERFKANANIGNATEPFTWIAIGS